MTASQITDTYASCVLGSTTEWELLTPESDPEKKTERGARGEGHPREWIGPKPPAEVEHPGGEKNARIFSPEQRKT